MTPYWGEGDSRIMQAQAAELVRSKPDVIAVQSATALRAKRVSLLMNVNNPNWTGWSGAGDKIFRASDMQLVPSRITGAPGIERELSAIARQTNSGFIVLPDPFLGPYRQLIVDSAVKHRVPAIYSAENYVDRGGLISYSTDDFDAARRAAEYVSRILRGEKPNDLPVQMPSKFRLAVNLKAAKSLGLAIPQSVLLGADKVIQ